MFAGDVRIERDVCEIDHGEFFSLNGQIDVL
jgi:hypothetical protein